MEFIYGLDDMKRRLIILKLALAIRNNPIPKKMISRSSRIAMKIQKTEPGAVLSFSMCAVGQPNQFNAPTAHGLNGAMANKRCGNACQTKTYPIPTKVSRNRETMVLIRR